MGKAAIFMIFIWLFVLVLMLSGCFKETDSQLIGGQKDGHGCLIAAGYSWCEQKHKCIRIWEEPCETNANQNLYVCNKDSDCIPHPKDCHPMECINKKYEGNFTRPEACTMMYSYEAAYTSEDCACVNNRCINKNIGRSVEGAENIDGSVEKSCAEICKSIPFSKEAPSIAIDDLERGWYYGQLNQKKPGTPDNWLHRLEGTRSAMWFDPEKSEEKGCDCITG